MAMPNTPPFVALCLDCNYELHGLPVCRCPECGRPFDLDDVTTFNRGRSLNWLDRKLLAPIGMPTFAAVALRCGGTLHLSLSTDIYYMGIYVILLMLMCGATAAVLGMRLALRGMVVPPLVPRPKDRTRIKIMAAIAALTCVLVIAQVPLRIAFLFARPGLDKLVADIRSGRMAEPISSHRAGPFTVSTSASYGGDDTLFFVYDILRQSGGLAYCPTNGPEGYYNTGTDGPLGWHWHWWIDD